MISVDDRWDRPCRVAADGTGKDPRPTRRTLFAVLSSPERRIYERHPGHHSLVRPTFTSTGTRPRRPPMCQNRLPAVLAARSAAPSSGRSQARCPSRPSRKRPTCGNTASFGSAPTRSGGAPAPLIRRVLPPRGTRPASPHPRAWHNPATGTPSPCATRSSHTAPRMTSTSLDAGCHAQGHRDPHRPANAVNIRSRMPYRQPWRVSPGRTDSTAHGAASSFFFTTSSTRVADPRPHRHLDGVGAERRTSRHRRLDSWYRAPPVILHATRRRQAWPRADLRLNCAG